MKGQIGAVAASTCAAAALLAPATAVKASEALCSPSDAPGPVAPLFKQSK